MLACGCDEYCRVGGPPGFSGDNHIGPTSNRASLSRLLFLKGNMAADQGREVLHSRLYPDVEAALFVVQQEACRPRLLPMLADGLEHGFGIGRIRYQGPFRLIGNFIKGHDDALHRVLGEGGRNQANRRGLCLASWS